ncbi:MAG: Gfo/Idh/MocA family oxidoreductase, partial [Candidatus Hydrogenedentes bacterium]|nr:Gfo/Idh/MocA family oxidoreductase [Candidatus Hydrogenedentota bacterium]
MSKVSRRVFLGTAAGALTWSLAAQGAPSDRIRHAVIGVGGQGRNHARAFHALPGCDVVAVCDVDPERRAQAVGELEGASEIAQVEDFRAILDDASIDTVSIATPDHWHTPVALAALAAGKHVYVEKPCCHNIHEGRALVAAQEKTGLCVQHGTQSRSGQGIKDAVAFMRDGHLGKVRLAKAINHQLRAPIGRAPVSEPPEGVNYDMWLGPAPKHAYTTNRWHYNWHWFWDYGTGDMGNDGVHQIDVARWGLGAVMPKAVSAMGGQLYYDDDHETPDTQMVTFDYGDCYLVYEMRLWTNYKMDGHDNGVIFYGDNGTIEVGRNGCELTYIDQPKKKIGDGHDFAGNVANF